MKNPAKPGGPAPSFGEEDEGLVPNKPKKQGLFGRFLPTGLSRALVVSTLLICATVWVQSLYNGRYELMPAANPQLSGLYRLDRWTGAVSYCAPADCVALQYRSAVTSASEGEDTTED